MPPVITASNKNFEDTLTKVFETLKRTENRTLETKKRAQKTLTASSQHLHKAEVVQKEFSQSLSLSRETFQTDGVNGMRKTSLDYANASCSNRFPLKDKGNIMDEGSQGPSKSGTNNGKIRSSIFETLDRLFRFQSRKPKRSPNTSSHHESSFDEQSYVAPELKSEGQTSNSGTTHCNDIELSFDTLKTLNQYEADTLPREKSFLANDNRPYIDALECSYETSSSSEESFGEFIEGPLRFYDVPLDSTIESPQEESDFSTENHSLLPPPTSLICTPKVRYEKKGAKGKDVKIKNRLKDRHSEKRAKLESEPEFPESLPLPQIKNRPDSPRPMNFPLVASKSLPTLIGAIEELDSSDSTGVDTFSRDISYRPSSTISKSLPSFALNHENDDDALSSSSSFSSLQRTHDLAESARKSVHESTLPMPSALCKDVLISPITVPVKPLAHASNEKHCTGISEHSFRRRAEVYQLDHSGLSFSSNASSNAENSPQQENAQPPSFKPPPPPPPPPSQTNSLSGTIRSLLPVTIFTQKKKGSVFEKIKNPVSIDEADAVKCKEKFQWKKSSGKKLKGLIGRDKHSSMSSEDIKFLQNIEMFLKTYKIEDHKPLITCIKILSTHNSNLNPECFTTLIQFLPKKEMINQMRKGNPARFGNRPAGAFAVDLLAIDNLHGSLELIQFSLDFQEGTMKLENWISSFIGICKKIVESEKFIMIINITMRLLETLNPDGKFTIYGFDVQELTKLATKTAEDGTTFLQFIIEYILDREEYKPNLDFYKAFKNLPEVTKTSIIEMKAQCEEWKQCLAQYTSHVQPLAANDPQIATDFRSTNSFQKVAEEKLCLLNSRLAEAKKIFENLKEHFGLMNSNTTEVMFFDSMSKFINAYKTTYDNVISRRKREDQAINSSHRRLTPPKGSEERVCPGEVLRRSIQERRKSMHGNPAQVVPTSPGKSKVKRYSLSPSAIASTSDPLEQRLTEFVLNEPKGRRPRRRHKHA